MAVFSSGFYTAGLFFFCLELSVVRVSVAETCEKLDDCSCKKSNGKVISLWELDGGSAGPPPDFKDKPGDKPEFEYSWNPCTPFAEKDGCKSAIICQTYKPSDITFPIAKEASSFTVEADKTITLKYAEAKYDGQTRTGVITLKCDPSVKGTLGKFTQAPGTYTYSATLTSKCACDDGCPRGDHGGGSSSSSGLSVGSILLIVFFPLLLVYFIAGILFNKYHKGVESVPEMIPNHSFWGDLPFLVKDGFVFTFQGIAGCCKGLQRKLKGDSYAEI